jgi:hypothetical protein
MKISIVLICGYFNDSNIEKDRAFKFQSCLKNLNNIEFSEGDNVVISEYGPISKFEKTIKNTLKVPFKYIHTKSENGFNQSIAKNKASEISNEIIFYINSDILLQKNVLNVIREEFKKNEKIYCTCARHDVFLKNLEIDNFIQTINEEKNYENFDTFLDDPGWHYALKKPQRINTVVKKYINENYKNKMIYDFQSGYIVFGDFIAITKKTWEKYKFDEKISALTDVFLRHYIFNSDKDYQLSLVHDKTASFHLCGDDYQEQEKEGSGKDLRLKADYNIAVTNYHQCRHWIIFSYRKEYDEMIEKYYFRFSDR